jgi:hypothetical protein
MKYPPKTIYACRDGYGPSAVGEDEKFDFYLSDENRGNLPDGLAAVYEFKGFVIVHNEVQIADATPEEVDRLLNRPAEKAEAELPF